MRYSHLRLPFASLSLRPELLYLTKAVYSCITDQLLEKKLLSQKIASGFLVDESDSWESECNYHQGIGGLSDRLDKVMTFMTHLEEKMEAIQDDVAKQQGRSRYRYAFRHEHRLLLPVYSQQTPF